MKQDSCCNRGPAEYAAITLLLLQEEHAISVIKQFDPEEVQKVALAMLGLDEVEEIDVNSAINSFLTEIDILTVGKGDIFNETENLLSHSIGKAKTQQLLEDNQIRPKKGKLEAARWLSAEKLWAFAKDKPPALLVDLLLCLDQNKAAKILEFVSKEERAEIVKGVSTRVKVSAEDKQELDKALEEFIEEDCAAIAKGGEKYAASLLSHLPASISMEVVSALNFDDPSLAARIRSKLLTFSMIFELEEKPLRMLLTELPTDLLLQSLSNIATDQCEKLFRVLPGRAAEHLRDELKSGARIPGTDSSNAQKSVVDTVWRLVEEGKIELK